MAYEMYNDPDHSIFGVFYITKHVHTYSFM